MWGDGQRRASGFAQSRGKKLGYCMARKRHLAVSTGRTEITHKINKVPRKSVGLNKRVKQSFTGLKL